MTIKFYFADIKFTLKKRGLLKKHIKDLFLEEKKNLKSLSYVFVSDDYLLNINRDFLKHDYYTDVITFNLSSHLGEIEGEIYISVDRVKDNAQQAKADFITELRRVMIHGALHLCGYKDKSKKDQFVMRKNEEKYLSRFD